MLETFFAEEIDVNKKIVHKFSRCGVGTGEQETRLFRENTEVNKMKDSLAWPRMENMQIDQPLFVC